MSRADLVWKRFCEYSTHPWLKRVVAKLSAADRATALHFVYANGDMDKGRFEFAINRMFLDKPKPKNWTAILELLTCANAAID